MKPSPLISSDALSEALRLIDMQACVYRVATFTHPWGVRFPKQSAHFHFLQSGRSFLRLEQPDCTIEMNTGDLIVLGQSSGHCLFSDADAGLIDIGDAAKSNTTEVGLRVGGGGNETRMICGKFVVDDFTWERVLCRLPAVIHVPATLNSNQWFESALGMLSVEARSHEPGRQFAISSLVRLILICAVRHWINVSATTADGWLAALRDHRIATALSLIHADPGHPWTLQKLASRTAMSRSLFASRFAKLVGEPPVSYLTQWRIEVGRRLLRSTDATIAEVAQECRYESETTFGRSFKKITGQTPSEYRK